MALGEHNPVLQDETQFSIGKLRSWVSASLWRRSVLFSAAYFICAEAGNFLSPRGGTFVSFWLPAGLYLAVLLLNPTRNWPWLALAVLPANLVFDLSHGTSFVVIICFYFANTVEAVTGAWLVRRFVAERPMLSTLKEFIGLAGFASLFSAMLGAVIGAATLIYFGFSHSFGQSWEVWWGSNAMAILILTPFILTWFSKPSWPRKDFVSPKKIAEMVALLLALLLYIWLLFILGHGLMSMNRSWAIPLLLWAGLRFGQRGATAVSLFLSLTISYFTTQYATGLNGVQISTSQYIFPMQAVLAMVSLVALIPAIVVAERERTLAELRESEERFKNLAAAAFEGICISENGKILDVNNQFVTMFGYERRDEIIGRQIIEFVTPEWRDSVAERIRIGKETIYGHQLLRKDGSSFPAEAQAKIVRVGDQTLRMTALRDITERKQAEVLLMQSEQRFSLMFKNSPLPVALVRLADGTILDVNESFLRMAGYTREETIGHTALELNFYPDPGRRAFVMDQIHRHGLLHDHEQLFRDKSGKIQNHILWFDLISINGEECTLVTALDITGRKRAELEREEAVTREQQARAEYTLQLIASQEAERTRIATELHDSLGQNLLLIKNRVQLALADKQSPADLRGQLEGIGALATQSIAEVRQISRDLHPHQLDHLGLTRALEAMIDSTAKASGFAFEWKIESVDDIFHKDAALNLYRVVQEALNNILKHSRAKNGRIKLERDVHEVQLQIEDDGCGFKADEIRGGGKGMGLKNIAERVRILGGKFKIESQPERGTQIEVKVPIPDGQ